MGEPFRVGYVRCSTDEQDVEIQTEQLLTLGVPHERIFIDKGSPEPLARTDRARQRAHRSHFRRRGRHRSTGRTDHDQVRPVRPQHGRGRRDPDRPART
ncbi:recombinase family protein [Nocardia fluminea]|uniref:recombinase family protein n=1 Tax=Nocardia fluminea TaxID=134984 RepID=UPI00344337CB